MPMLRVADSGTLDEIMINCNAMQFAQWQCVGRGIGVSTLLYPWTMAENFNSSTTLTVLSDCAAVT